MSRNQFAVTAAAFVGFIGFTLVMPFVALYVRELGVTDMQDIAIWTGVTLGVTPAVAALCGPFWGRIGDRFGNKILVQRSLVSCVIVMILMAYATRAWHLFALRALQGFVAGYGPLTLSMAALSAPREKLASALGTVQTAQRVAPAIGPLVGGLLAAAVGLRNTFLVSAGVYLVALIIVTVMYREPRREAVPREASEPVTCAGILAFENFLVLMFVIFGLQLVDRSFGPILLLHLGQLGYASADAAMVAGLLFSTLAIFGALGNQMAAVVLRRASARVVIAVMALAAAGALALFSVSISAWALTAAISLFGLAVGTAMTTAFAAAGSVIPRHVHGRSFGLLTGASLIGTAASPVLAGLVASRSIRVVFYAGVAALALLALLVRHVMVDRNLQAEPPPAVEES